MSQSLDRRIAALEAKEPAHRFRVTTMLESPEWTLEERKKRQAAHVAGLAKHRGLTVIVRRFFGPGGSSLILTDG